MDTYGPHLNVSEAHDWSPNPLNNLVLWDSSWNYSLDRTLGEWMSKWVFYSGPLKSLRSRWVNACCFNWIQQVDLCGCPSNSWTNRSILSRTPKRFLPLSLAINHTGAPASTALPILAGGRICWPSVGVKPVLCWLCLAFLTKVPFLFFTSFILVAGFISALHRFLPPSLVFLASRMSCCTPDSLSSEAEVYGIVATTVYCLLHTSSQEQTSLRDNNTTIYRIHTVISRLQAHVPEARATATEYWYSICVN